ncbi:MAG: NAD(P)/FAD-dependent oxidoreductase [Akkermansiaceae bacterium]
MNHLLVIGGGPAGLRAAEVASQGGVRVTLCEQKRSVGRKFLVAGKSGLNLTHAEPRESFEKKYRGPNQPSHLWPEMLGRFDNEMIREWAHDLGVETFAQRTGRVYPTTMKAAPLLRRWVERLRANGVDLRMNHRLTSLSADPLRAEFETPDGTYVIEPDAIILALGGGSWPQTGSDGRWVNLLAEKGIAVSPLQSANCGWEVAWPENLVSKIEGKPLKNLILTSGSESAKGELMLTHYGIEGGPVYKLGPALREMDQPSLSLDLKPDFAVERLVAKMESAKRNFLMESATRWKLPDEARLLLDHYHGPFDSAQSLAEAAKALVLPITRPRPIAEAISSAGGVAWPELNDDLMIRGLPGIFVAGEMIDWEAPTGGYLLQGCFASGTRAAEAALRKD